MEQLQQEGRTYQQDWWPSPGLHKTSSLLTVGWLDACFLLANKMFPVCTVICSFIDPAPQSWAWAPCSMAGLTGGAPGWGSHSPLPTSDSFVIRIKNCAVPHSLEPRLSSPSVQRRKAQQLQWGPGSKRESGTWISAGFSWAHRSCCGEGTVKIRNFLYKKETCKILSSCLLLLKCFNVDILHLQGQCHYSYFFSQLAMFYKIHWDGKLMFSPARASGNGLCWVILDEQTILISVASHSLKVSGLRQRLNA